MSGPAIEVLAPGLLTTVQDLGRHGMQRYGVARCGALDEFAAVRANALVGNPPEAALLEITVEGPRLRFAEATAVGLAGADLGAALDGRRLDPGTSRLARAGSVLAFEGRRHGARAYLAVGGGLEVPALLGSRSTDLRAGFGGHRGRALWSGDRIAVGRGGGPPRWGVAPGDEAGPDEVLRVLPGPHVDRRGSGLLEGFCARVWRVSAEADRMGCRLSGDPLAPRATADVPPLGLPTGAIQLPADGLPIVLLADHQPTGGYTVIACLIRADLPLIAQRLPGDELRFAVTTVDEARAALAARRAAALRVVIEEPAEMSWAGSLE